MQPCELAYCPALWRTESRFGSGSCGQYMAGNVKRNLIRALMMVAWLTQCWMPLNPGGQQRIAWFCYSCRARATDWEIRLFTTFKLTCCRPHLLVGKDESVKELRQRLVDHCTRGEQPAHMTHRKTNGGGGSWDVVGLDNPEKTHGACQELPE